MIGTCYDVYHNLNYVTKHRHIQSKYQMVGFKLKQDYTYTEKISNGRV